MIRYVITPEELRAKIAAHDSGWQEKASGRTEILSKLGRYAEETANADSGRIPLIPFWGDIKAVFITLQHGKCIYCENKLEEGPAGAIQWDLEHFRPKRQVRPWQFPGEAGSFDFPLGAAFPEGYYLLAYHPGNYAAACKTCNTTFKSNCFPIAGKRIGGKREPDEYRRERPYLVYPFDGNEEDPEALITFEGFTAVPRPRRGPRRRRAAVMIAFFELNRYGLRARRAEFLVNTLAPNLKLTTQGDLQAGDRVSRMLSPAGIFTNCARSFVRLYRKTPIEAKRHLFLCERLLAIEQEQ